MSQIILFLIFYVSRPEVCTPGKDFNRFIFMKFMVFIDFQGDTRDN